MRRSEHAGLNALRVVAMLMVCLVHTIYPQNPDDNIYNLWMCFLHSVAVAGVDLFVLITGYFLVDKKWSFLRYVRLWWSVVFYSISVILLFYILDKSGISSGIYDFGLARYYIAQIMFGSSYWFFAAYTALYLIVPFLNRAVDAMNQRMHSVLILLTAGVIAIMNMMCFGALYGGGNVFVWFIVLYLIGAYIRKYAVSIKVPYSVLLVMIAVCTLIPTLIKFSVDSEWISNAVGGLSSPFVVLYSVSVFLLFSRWESCKFTSFARILSVMSSLTFGVYLSHVHPFAFKWLLAQIEIWYKDWGYSYYAPIVMAFCVYMGCSVIEWGRVLLFRILYLNRLLDRISLKMESRFVELINKGKTFGCF